jgi:hypothetical protein
MTLPRDLSEPLRIDVHDQRDRAYWAAKLKVSPEDLVDAVSRAGSNPDAVRRYLRERSSPGAGTTGS